MRLAFEVSASCQRAVPVSSRKFAFRPKEVHDREDAVDPLRGAGGTPSSSKVERVVLNALVRQMDGFVAGYLRLWRLRLPSSSEKPIHLRRRWRAGGCSPDTWG